jgi:hypothetical protein
MSRALARLIVAKALVSETPEAAVDAPAAARARRKHRTTTNGRPGTSIVRSAAPQRARASEAVR